ncbi:GNAT family N-acetyltransferase [Oceanirhabdus seepicola]|uniref:GNAT family N-acetyltransferase n=1 Tax=Oceanirhabdus seepicola TaxID=2828781 RepID=A0A9J6P638_9CLOT|nr:GNAT family N-acetyltransferase [Oceanirhabdus seepicola]MCM1992191.1 GNAT family N-acetyltransferase [Oceanirhabdus seepicola]
MKINLKRTLSKEVESSYKWGIEYLTVDGIELTERLKCYLSKFTEGILDPDIAGKKPDKFIENLQNSVFGEFSKRYIITAYDKEEVVGILIGIPINERRLHIYSLHASAEYRGKGVGSDLLTRCINDMYKNDFEEISLDVHSDNKPAYNLYRKFNFLEIKDNIK